MTKYKFESKFMIFRRNFLKKNKENAARLVAWENKNQNRIELTDTAAAIIQSILSMQSS